MRKISILFLLLVTIFVASQSFAQTPVVQGPTVMPQLNTDFFVGQVKGIYPTIQSVVTQQCASTSAGSRVIIPAGSPADGISGYTISTVTSGCVKVSIEDRRVIPVGQYKWVTSVYVLQSSGSNGSGTSTPATNNVLRGNGTANGVVAAVGGTDYVPPILANPANGQNNDITKILNYAISRNHFNFTCDNSDGWYAGVGYEPNGMYTGDIGFAMLTYPSYFTPAQVKNIVTKTIGAKNVAGDFPEAVAKDCTSASSQFFTGFDSHHGHVTADSARSVSLLTYLYYRETGDLSLYTNSIAAIKTAWSRVPRNGVTHLITVVAGDEYVPCTGFMEVMRSIGDNACANTMYYYSALALATLATAAGDTTNATFFSSEASIVQAGTISSLTDATTKLLKADTNQLSSNLDVVASSVACFPYAGLAPMLGSTQCAAIANYLDTNSSTLFFNGFARESPTGWAVIGTIPSSGGAPYGSLGGRFGPTLYQDGYFGFHAGWALSLLNQVDPAKIPALLLAFRDSSNPVIESYSQTHVTNSGDSQILMTSPVGAKLISDVNPAPLPVTAGVAVLNSVGIPINNTAPLALPSGTTIGGQAICLANGLNCSGGGSGTAPMFVNGGATQNGTTVASTVVSPSLTVTAGDLIVVSCGGGTGPTSFTVTSSQGDTSSGSTAFQNLPAGSGIHQGFYFLSAVGGATTFTCNASASTGFLSIGAIQYHKGSLSTLDTSSANGVASSSTYTTNTFSTTATAQSLIVVCGHAGFGGTLSTGTIGALTTNSRITATPVCEDAITSGPQTSITGTTTASASGNWAGFAMAFK